MAAVALKVTALMSDEYLDSRAVKCSSFKGGFDDLSLLKVMGGCPEAWTGARSGQNH